MQQNAKLVRISAVYGAITFSLVVFAVSVPAILLVKLLQLFDPTPPAAGTSWAIWLAILLANTASAFVVGGLCCAAFNVVARVTGGLPYRTQVNDNQAEP